MDRKQIILTVLAANKDYKYSPIQLQKLFFLIDKFFAENIGGPYFDFQPYHYGPFDKYVYYELEELSEIGDVKITLSKYNGYKLFELTEEGKEKGIKYFEKLDHKLQKALKKLNTFVTSISFTQLISSIYKAYPEMKINSLFNK